MFFAPSTPIEFSLKLIRKMCEQLKSEHLIIIKIKLSGIWNLCPNCFLPYSMHCVEPCFCFLNSIQHLIVLALTKSIVYKTTKCYAQQKSLCVPAKAPFLFVFL